MTDIEGRLCGLTTREVVDAAHALDSVGGGNCSADSRAIAGSNECRKLDMTTNPSGLESSSATACDSCSASPRRRCSRSGLERNALKRSAQAMPGVGEWVNADPNARGIVQIELQDCLSVTTCSGDTRQIAYNAGWRMGVWDKCSPTNCDWGWSAPSFTTPSGRTYGFYGQGFARRKVYAKMSQYRPGQLWVYWETDFVDPNRPGLHSSRVVRALMRVLVIFEAQRVKSGAGEACNGHDTSGPAI